MLYKPHYDLHVQFILVNDAVMGGSVNDRLRILLEGFFLAVSVTKVTTPDRSYPFESFTKFRAVWPEFFRRYCTITDADSLSHFYLEFYSWLYKLFPEVQS